MESINVNVQLLKGKIVECGFTKASLAETIGINTSTLWRHMKDGRFSLKEVQEIRKALGLSDEESIRIFFAD